jgi:membrane protein DedA with SNARE-associated domain
MEIAGLGLVALIGLLFVKETGIPVPVPGDLLVIGAGISAATGGLEPITTLIAIVAATVLGGAVQFLLVRGAARGPMLAILARFGVPPDRLERFAESLRRRGATGVAVARMTPGIRIGAVAASGLAGLAIAPFIGGLAVGNAVFAGAHFALGMVAGEPALRLVSGAALPLVAVGLLLALVGLGAWWLIRRRRAAQAGTDAPDLAATVAAWADACCPACLALAVVETRTDRSRQSEV